jgi:hypothetical protein
MKSHEQNQISQMYQSHMTDSHIYIHLVLTPTSFCRTEPLPCYDNFEIQTNLHTSTSLISCNVSTYKNVVRGIILVQKFSQNKADQGYYGK